MRRTADQSLEGAIVELQQNGAYVKATAIDPVSGIEVSIVGAASSPQALLQNAAVRKLRYVLEKKKGPASSGRGVLI
jgi:hypothetical protein